MAVMRQPNNVSAQMFEQYLIIDLKQQSVPMSLQRTPKHVT
jgi:hypothetical protein